MRVLSLFDGISCGRLALSRANLQVETYFASEIDKHAITVCNNNWKDTVHIGDVTTINYDGGILYTEYGAFSSDIDIIIGGSPCQGFSTAGIGKAFEDSRSSLFFEFVRLVTEVGAYNPDCLFLLENVKMKQEYINIISNSLGVEPISINSNLVSAQNRERLYWTNIPDVTMPTNRNIELKDILIDVPPTFKIFTKKKPLKPKTTQHKSGCLTGGGNSGGNHSDMDVIVFNELDVPLMPNSGMISLNEITRARRYNLSEWELLQTLPIGYTKGISDTQRYKAIGNAWTVDVITHIFNHIKERKNVK